MDDEKQQDAVWQFLPKAELIAKKLGLDPSLVAELILSTLLKVQETYWDKPFDELQQIMHGAITKRLISYIKREQLETQQLELQKLQFGQKHYFGDEIDGIPPEITAEQIRAALDQHEFELLQKRAAGKTYEQIGIEYGVIRQTVYERVKKAIEKCKKLCRLVANWFQLA